MARLLIAVSLIALLIASAGGLGAWWAWRQLQAPFHGFAGEELRAVIGGGDSVAGILETLESEGVIKDALLARVYWQFILKEPSIKAGEYLFQGASSTPVVLDKLVRGDVLTHRITILEGLTLAETAQLLAEGGFGSVDRFLEEMSHSKRVQSVDALAKDLEGYLFPDTYAFARGTSEAQIVDTMVSTFLTRFDKVAPNRKWPNEHAPAVRDLVTLASIVEKEALLDDERPVIAGVYTNRLRIGMGLYADPTLVYAMKLADRWDGNLRKQDLEMSSPYNTYRTVGLPPGPICSPGEASLAAAAEPAEVPHLYFVSRNDGAHVFADTLAEHNRNVYKWQKLYWRRRWAEERERDRLH